MDNSLVIGKTQDGPALSLDLARLVDSRMLIQGNSGGGKSWLLRLICERAAGKVPIILLDPEGEFASLREKLDLVLVGSDGEIAADVRSAGLLARKLVELEVSAVIDLYELQAHQRREYVRAFLHALVGLPRSLWHPTIIALDEAHKFCPEKGTGEAVSTQSVIDLMSLGRKRGYCGILATQRFSKLHNDAIAETNNVCIGRTWLDADQKRAGDYLGMTAADRKTLRDLRQGEFYAFGPALSEPGVVRFISDKVETTHPKAGERHRLKPPRASEAVRHIVEQLGDLPEQAEAEVKDMDEARRKIADLERQLRAAEKGAPQVEVKTLEVPVMTDAQMGDISELTQIITGQMGTLEQALKTVEKAIQMAVNARGAAPRSPLPSEQRRAPAAAAAAHVPAAPLRLAPHAARAAQPASHPSPPSRDTSSRQAPRPFPNSFTPNATQQRILDALAWYESIGIKEPSNIQVGAIALIDATGGHFSNVVGPLSTNGLIQRGSGSMRLTEAGRALAAVPESVATLADYHQVLRQRVLRARTASRRTVDMLDVIIGGRGAALSTEEIGITVGIDHTGGHFSNTIGPLSTLGFIVREHGIVRPTEVLFPPGLK